MPKPKMGADIGEVTKNYAGGASAPDPVINAVNNGVGAVADDTTQQQTPQVQWGTNPSGMIADPNNNYAQSPIGLPSPGFNPNTDMNAGVPVSNTPAINQQGSPGFGLNANYNTAPDPTKIMATLMAGIGSYAG